MLSKFPRVVVGLVIGLFCLAWLYRSESSSFHTPAPGPQTPQHPIEKNEDPQREKPLKVHYADMEDPYASPTSTDFAASVSVPTAFPVIDRKSPFAYVFYATTNEYACSATVNIDRLLQFHTRHRIHVLLTDHVSPEYKKEFENMNVTVTMLKPPQHPRPRGNGPNSRESGLLKLHAFRMHQIDPSLKRVLVLDADQFIYKSLDSMFELPDVDLAAPRAYWRGKDTLSSTLMLVSLTDRVWHSVEQAIKELQGGEYALEVVNKVFADTAMVLPGQYATVDKHWLDWELPKWFRPEGDMFSQGMVREYSNAKLEELWRVININVGADQSVLPQPQPSMMATVPPPLPPGLRKRGLEKREEPNEKSEEEKLQEERKKAEMRHKEEEKKKDEERRKEEAKKKEDSMKEEKKGPLDHKDLGEVLTPEQAKKEEENANLPDKEHKPEPKPEEKHEHEEKPQEPKPPPPKLPQKESPKPPAPHPYTPETHPNRGPLEHLQHAVAVLHYGAVLKPWQKHVEGLREDHKLVHPMMYEQVKHWREHAQRSCPRIKREKGQVGADGQTWEWYHPVNNV